MQFFELCRNVGEMKQLDSDYRVYSMQPINSTVIPCTYCFYSSGILMVFEGIEDHIPTIDWNTRSYYVIRRQLQG